MTKYKDNDNLLIRGVTPCGTTFRPSDWAERMSGKLSSFRNHRIHYSPLLRPVMRDGHKCVLLDKRLKSSNPELYASIIEFANTHNLDICNDETTDK